MWPFKKRNQSPLQNLQAAKWAEREMQRQMKIGRKDPTPEELFTGFMFSVTRFSEGETETSEAVLFELGCFSLSAIDIWIFQNKPASRESVFDHLMYRFVELYSHIFQTDFEEIGSVLEQRLSIYGEIYGSVGMDIEKMIKALIQVMLFSQTKEKPCLYEREALNLDYIENFLMHMKISSWLKHCYPIILNCVKEVCNAQE